MLQVVVTRKIYNNKNGLLAGYTIADASGKTMDVPKDALKMAVINGQCECLNMTLTSDGRLIGGSIKKPDFDKLAKRKSKIQLGTLNTIYISKKKIVGGIEGNLSDNIEGMLSGRTIREKINNGMYSNVTPEDKGETVSKIKFSAIKSKVESFIRDSNINFVLDVEKTGEKYEYNISVLYAGEITELIMCLLEDALVTNGITVVDGSGSKSILRCKYLAGMSDIRKAVNSVEKALA